MTDLGVHRIIMVVETKDWDLAGVFQGDDEKRPRRLQSGEHQSGKGE